MTETVELLPQGRDLLIVQGGDMVSLTPAEASSLAARILRLNEELTPAEAAAELKVDVRSIYRLFRRKTGGLAFLDLGHRTKRIRRADLEEYKARMRGNACN